MKITFVTIGELTELSEGSTQEMSSTGLGQIEDIRDSSAWNNLPKPKNVFIGDGKAYRDAAQCLNVVPFIEAEACGGSDLNIRLIEIFVNSLKGDSLLIVDPNFLGPKIYNGSLLTITTGPDKKFTWPVKEEDCKVLVSGNAIVGIL